MPSKSTQALEETIAMLSDHLSELHGSMEQWHDSLAAAVSDIQQHLATAPADAAPGALAYKRFHIGHHFRPEKYSG
ncbi:UNVERIFIED_CONTAM: hypothetical protein Sradi_5757900 [Sesamum radiatum]|uniref:Uncharacterized protein n=1 Tax=Sesamum radiatum TaxID=300843 RepID=A0AAW2L6V9_SESRA